MATQKEIEDKAYDYLGVVIDHTIVPIMTPVFSWNVWGRRFYLCTFPVSVLIKWALTAVILGCLCVLAMLGWIGVYIYCAWNGIEWSLN